MVAGQPIATEMPFGALLGSFGNSLSSGFYLGEIGEIDVQPGHVGHELLVGLNMSDENLEILEGAAVLHLVRIPAGAAQWTGAVIDPSVTQPVSTGFHIGDGGTWDAQISDLGRELVLGLNMSAADLAAGAGRILVNVIYIPASSAAVQADPVSANDAGLRGGIPNPTSSAADIRYALPVEGDVHLRIHDAAGRVVRTLVAARQAAGDHREPWDLTDDRGRLVPAGAYFYQLSTAAGTQARRLVVTR